MKPTIGIRALGALVLIATQAQAAPPYATNVCAADRVPNLNCTANDVEIARLQVLNNVTTCRAGEAVTLDLRAFLHINAQDRHDIGIFLAKDGKVPIVPSASGGSADCAVFGIPFSPAPYANLDGNACGDFDRGGLPQGVETSLDLGNVTVTCKSDPNGYLDIPEVITWRNSAGTCQSPPEAWVEPENPSKCEFGVAARIEVQVLGRIVVVKQTDPDGAAGTFAFTASGPGVSPTQFSLSDGQQQVVATAPLGPVAQDYVITEQALAGFGPGAQIVCRDTDGDIAPFVDVNDTTRTITAHMSASGSDVTCTVTNAQQATITINKTAVGGDASFPFTGTPGIAPFDIATTAGSGQHVVSGLVAGVYTISEAVPSGWDLTALACTDPTGNTTVDLATGTATIDLANGESVACTYTDTKRASITVVKSTVGGDGTFGFSGPQTPQSPSGSFQIATSGGTGQVTLSNLQPGNYDVTESVPTGWDLTNLQCSDPSGGTSVNGATASVALAAGENVTCTWTDTRRGAIVVQKVVQGPDGTFDFTGAQSFSITTTGGNGSNTAAFASVAPGSYSIVESAQSGWSLTGLVCSDPTGNSSTDVPGRTATVNLGAGETVTCTFTNTRLATLTIIKQAVPHVAQPNTQSFGFTASGGLSPSAFSLSDDGVNSNEQTFTDVLPGSGYVVTETAVASWPLTALTCTDQGDPNPANRSTLDLANRSVTANLQPGESLRCTFTNVRNDNGTITVTKRTIGTVAFGAGGTFDFTNSGGSPGSQTNPDAFSITTTVPDPNGAQSLTALAAGAYTITETLQNGWDLGPIECVVTAGSNTTFQATGNAVTINLGTTGGNVDAVACSFVNTRLGNITIVKDATPNDAQDFTFQTTGGNGVPASFALDDDADGTLPNSQPFTLLPLGVYTFTEQANALWRLTDIACAGGAAVTTDVAGGLASIELRAGESVTCTYRNAKDGTITINKTAVGGAPGDTFTFQGPGALGGTIAGGQSLQGTFAAGTYSVTEVVPAGWDLSNIVCSGGTATITGATQNPTDAFQPGDNTVNITITEGQAASCTFTDTKRGSITVVKNTIGGDGSFGFTGPQAFDIETSAGTGQNTTAYASVAPGTYPITESVPAGWSLTALSCSDGSSTSLGTRTATVNVAAGENVTCTFTNTRLGTIRIVKRLQADATTTFTFSAPTALEPSGSFTLAPTVQATTAVRTFTNVAPGSYTITETPVPAGWKVLAITCSDPTANTTTDVAAGSAFINVAAGETVECIFDDTELSDITISVVSTGGTGTFAFTSTNLGANQFTETTVTSGLKASRTFTGLAPGTFTVTGLGATGWMLDGVLCLAESGETYWSINGANVSITVPHGESIECTYYYVLVPPPTSIPTLSPWLLVLLAGLVVAVGYRRLRTG